MAKFEGRGACAHCKKGVDVYSDKNGLAYYKCGPCQTKIMHQGRRESDKVLAGLDREAEEDGAAVPAPAPIPVRPAQAPKPPSPPIHTPPPPGKAGGGFLERFTL
jgi:DNA-directed RNA polymerase subunit RPC12/RpoP